MLKWDSRREDKGKHGNFENLWRGPFIISSVSGNNAFFLQELDGTETFGGPVNGRALKNYFLSRAPLLNNFNHFMYHCLKDK